MHARQSTLHKGEQGNQKHGTYRDRRTVTHTSIFWDTDTDKAQTISPAVEDKTSEIYDAETFHSNLWQIYSGRHVHIHRHTKNYPARESDRQTLYIYMCVHKSTQETHAMQIQSRCGLGEEEESKWSGWKSRRRGECLEIGQKHRDDDSMQ